MNRILSRDVDVGDDSAIAVLKSGASFGDAVNLELDTTQRGSQVRTAS
jgi:hypothetical protein